MLITVGQLAKLVLPLVLVVAAALSLSSVEKIGTGINEVVAIGHYAQLAQIDE